MGFDVNKIIMESIQEVMDESNKTPITEKVTETKVVTEDAAKDADNTVKDDAKDATKTTVTENIGEEAEQDQGFHGVAVASAIAAGLGALSLRKKLASLNEVK